VNSFLIHPGAKGFLGRSGDLAPESETPRSDPERDLIADVPASAPELQRDVHLHPLAAVEVVAWVGGDRTGEPIPGIGRAGAPRSPGRDGPGSNGSARAGDGNPMERLTLPCGPDSGPGTGQVLSFTRNGEVRLTRSSSEVEVVLSDGIRSTEPLRYSWR
jgi:hypothetical protein